LKLTDFEPDIIINFTGWNDFNTSIFNSGASTYYNVPYSKIEKWIEKPLMGLAANSAFFNSILYNAVNDRYKAKMERALETSNADAGDFAPTWIS